MLSTDSRLNCEPGDNMLTLTILSDFERDFARRSFILSE